MTRLGGKVGAVAKSASGFLLYVKKGEAKTASGAFIRPIFLTPKEVTNWRVSLVERGAYASVKAKYRDNAQSKEMEVTTGDENRLTSFAGSSKMKRKRARRRERNWRILSEASLPSAYTTGQSPIHGRSAFAPVRLS
ncbi:phage tail protein [Candidatus Hamiltonella defensa]|uniref:Phage tail protein n=1 Tax=Hamiltonella defensa subsp. Acyrthosiphon pisum (strain 5AT) TaxID=572265 RepID=C4K6I8_HAMD5|nr:phage tail protein [Candidatus Hamiltonella defensa]ACQ68181.1 phage tail protein [Candidatus Hamiltonella defensa 5AT (Acyrthosiphon pisum)]ATW22772.1 hypothetical protein BJP44_06905 [Candidatus Hamiltonella defensa]